MRHVLAILFGAGLTSATSWALGTLLFRSLRVRLARAEWNLLAFVTGSALLSGILFVLCSVHLARKGVYLAVAAIALAGVFLRPGEREPAAAPLPVLPRLWRWTFLVIVGVFAVVYFTNALAPELSPDGTAYHLAVVDRYDRAHGFERVPTSIYYNLSQAAELLFLMAYAFGKHSAAALAHFSFLAVLPWMALTYGRRFGAPLAGAAAGIFLFACPVIGVDGSSAYVDVALGVVLFAVFWILQIWDEQRDPALLVIAGILAGFAFGIKYTGFLAPLYTIGFVLWRRKNALRPVAVMVAFMAVFTLPWLGKNWVWTGNPMVPFGNRIFPNPWVHVSFERDYQRALRAYGLKDYRQLPLEVTIRGEVLGGLCGPLFLLLPLAVGALGSKQGRRALLAAVVFGLPFSSNIGTRFLIPALPFVSVALALAIARFPVLLYGTMLAHAVLSIPWVVALYCAPSAWRVEDIPVRAALRIESEDSFLRRKWPGYSTDRMIEDGVPRGESVFLFGTTAESYTSRRMLVKFLSAPNEVIGDILLTPILPDYQPTVSVVFQFPERAVRKLRVVQTQGSGEEMWSVAEFRVWRGGKEIPRAGQWRLTARPNPWDVQLAFDNSPVTRWKTWQAARPGDYVEIDFGSEQHLDEARIECSSEYTNKLIRLETLDGANRWIPAGADPIFRQHAISADLRRAAAFEMKARGVRYLLVSAEDDITGDFRRVPEKWGLKPLGRSGVDELYRFE